MAKRTRRAGARKAGLGCGASRMLATGLAIAASGVAAGPASAGSGSTTIFACYSDSTDALSYLKPPATSCPSGSTKISWAEIGPQGAQGKAGAQGAQGKSGANGAQGAQGEAGAQGGQGAQGRSGGAGAQGTPVQSGTAGAQGTTGANGPQGATGARGATGPQGGTGATGGQGATGPQGATGAMGAQGTTGPQGATGPQGIPGAVQAAYDYVKSSPSIPPDTTMVVARFSPTGPGYFVVTDTTDIGMPKTNASCWLAELRSDEHLVSITPPVENFDPGNSRTAPLTVTGDVLAGAGSPIWIECKNDGSVSSDPYQSELTAVQVNGISSEVSKRPAQRFTRSAHAPGLR